MLYSRIWCNEFVPRKVASIFPQRALTPQEQTTLALKYATFKLAAIKITILETEHSTSVRLLVPGHASIVSLQRHTPSLEIDLVKHRSSSIASDLAF